MRLAGKPGGLQVLSRKLEWFVAVIYCSHGSVLILGKNCMGRKGSLLSVCAKTECCVKAAKSGITVFKT
jgi:hypothetical protein